MRATESSQASFLESLVGNAKKSSPTASATAKTAAKAVAKTTVNSMANPMVALQKVNCPTCGSSAERHHSLSDGLVRTQCPRCDYLMVLCSKTGRVVEAYAPSFSPAFLAS